MKKENKGFILVETLIVSVFILSTLIFLFVEFQKIDNSYNTTFTYNTTDNLYSVYNIKEYLSNNGYSNLKSTLTTNNLTYLDITDCSATYLTNTSYCVSLLTTLKAKQVLFTTENPTPLINDLKNISTISEKMKDFIRYNKFDDEATKNRLFVEFTDGTFGSLKIFFDNLTSVEVLVVAGGGGGGRSEPNPGGDGGGGAGAGGLIYVSAATVSAQLYVVTVGNGGLGSIATNSRGANGQDSIFNTYIAFGGGGGGTDNDDYLIVNKGASGGSGGGAANTYNQSTLASNGVAGQGNGGGGATTSSTLFRGGSGGGGAGAAGVERTSTIGGAGGVGLSNSISGTAIYYAGGGGGGGDANTGGVGGNGGGAAGGSTAQVGYNGTVNRGGGGGGGGSPASGTIPSNGGNGGSGIVIIRYYGVQKATGGVVTSVGGYTIHTFTSSSSFNVWVE